jgi:hypothetical protein
LVTMGCISVGAHGASTHRDAEYRHRDGTRRVDALPLGLMAGREPGTARLSDVWSRPRLIVLGQASLAASLPLISGPRR